MFVKTGVGTAMKMLLGIVGLAMFLSGCSDEDVTREPAVPRVKLYTVGEADNERTRRFSGSLSASAESPLSFPLSGTVEVIRAAEGDIVREGQMLARLDDQPIRIALDAARAKLAGSRARLDDARATYERYSDLGASGAISQADLETATANYASARSDVNAAQSEIQRLERDLSNTQLVAPFDGTIAERIIEPFQEVSPGQRAFVLETATSLEVNVQIPESMIGEVNYGDTVEVTFPAVDGLSAVGTVQTIGSRAESGNSFPVTVLLHTELPEVRPGMTAGVTFRIDSRLGGLSVYLIPISAVAIEVGVSAGTIRGGSENEAPVFVYDADSQRLQVRRVKVGDIRGNFLEVIDGLSEGDRVVSAGVPFLRDGQIVEEWRPELGLDNG